MIQRCFSIFVFGSCLVRVS